MIKRLIVVLSMVFMALFISNAQDIEVKKFEPLEKDHTAAMSPRNDINGNDCIL